ncbi:MAG TPA: c-type cytochrome domain-containing protein, partial [Gemmataceae bacterium]|nr:c-type cytochrome domain-containing protein [Gemmataceae bacterium]
MKLPIPAARGVAFVALVALLAALVLAGGADLTAQEKARPFVDPDRAFTLGDADKDGKLSRDEFEKLMSTAPAFREKAKAIDFLFARLDADKDGKLTPDEFKKIADMAGPKDGKGFLKKGFPKKKDNPPPAVAEKPATAEQVAFFEKKIRPVLVAQCYECHSEESKKSKGGLVVDTRDGLRAGGDNGPALIPGDPRRSLLVKAIHQADGNLKMPPKSKLSDEAIADFEKWIASGAADPRTGAKAAAAPAIDIEKGRQFWAFQPPKKATPPAVQNAGWAKTDID